MIAVDFSDNRVVDDLTRGDADPVSATMFGGIALSVVNALPEDPIYPDSDNYGAHFNTVFNYLSGNLIRFPGGEMPDGFVHNAADNVGLIEGDAGYSYDWAFYHNHMNGGDHVDVYNTLNGGTPPLSGAIDQTYLSGLVSAFSLDYPELIHPGLLETLGDDVMTFSDSLQAAISTNSTYTMVLPEFQYMRPPSTSSTGAFNADDHVRLDNIVNDVTLFLNNLFLNGAYNGGNIPTDFVMEIGNEASMQSNWNTNIFPAPTGHVLDGYSAYAIGVLSAVAAFREDHPNVVFRVSLQANSGNFVRELARNFYNQDGADLIDIEESGAFNIQEVVNLFEETGGENNYGVLGLLAEVDVIGLMHNGLDSNLTTSGTWGDAYLFEDNAANVWGPEHKGNWRRLLQRLAMS